MTPLRDFRGHDVRFSELTKRFWTRKTILCAQCSLQEI